MVGPDSSQVVVNLQPFERLSKMLIGGVLTDFFSPDSGVVTGIQAGTGSAAAMTDWDGDGDGLLSNADKDLLKDLTKPKSRPPTPDELMTGKLDAKDLVLLVQLLNGP